MPKESEIIANIRRKAATVDGLLVGIGDDAAVIKHTGASDLLACCDLSVEGVHFRMDWAKPKWIGRKALAVTLSDIAAMGGAARYAMVSLALPHTSQNHLADEIMQGIFEMADESAVAIIGGDTSSSRDSLFIDTSVLGECAKGQAVKRSGANPDEAIFVTGGLGASALGLLLLEQGYRLKDSDGHKINDQKTEKNLAGEYAKDEASEILEVMRQQAIKKHLLPEPRLLFGKMLGDSGLATAMIDISDGLSTDLSHILEESDCGAIIYAEVIPVAECLQKLASLTPEIEALKIALHSGEEYELLFTARSENQQVISALALAANLQVTQIGCTVEGRELQIEDAGKIEVLLPAGYEHKI